MIAATCFAVLVTLSSASVANAQGRYANTYSRNDVNGFIRNLENSSDVFSRDFQNANRPTSSERRVVENFENAVDRLRNRFDSNDNWWQSRNEVQAIMPAAQQVNVLMNNQRYARSLERQWRDLRRDVNKLADTFDLPGVAGGGWNGGGNNGGWNGGNNGGGWGGGVGTGNAPSWAVGTYYGRNPQTGGTIQLTINRNGQVTVNFDGNMTYGTVNGNNLNIDGARARISQITNGIRTRRTDNGEVIDYYRGNAGGWNGGGNYPGPIGGNVPNWAVGTFNARSPQDGGNITMTIRENGEVYIQFQNGGSQYGTIYGNTLTVNGATATISQIRNGIRTTRTDNGERINYYR
jgi:hypothetical protein